MQQDGRQRQGQQLVGAGGQRGGEEQRVQALAVVAADVQRDEVGQVVQEQGGVDERRLLQTLETQPEVQVPQSAQVAEE